jgi:predicted ribosome-associated RNA-binding protein Tma20
MFAPDGDKPGAQLLPSLYLMFNELNLHGSLVLKIYIKSGVEEFLFNGADLMWKGVLSLSRPEFKTNEIVEIYARNSLIN